MESVSIAQNTQTQQSQISTFPYAGFWLRLAAYSIDIILALALVFPVAVLITFFASGFDGTLEETALVLGRFVGGLVLFVVFFASVIFVGRLGATPGNVFFGLSVVKKDGSLPGIGLAFLREIFRFILILTVGIGLFWVLFDEKKQSLYDKISGTYVVHTRPIVFLKRILAILLVVITTLVVSLVAVFYLIIIPAKIEMDARDLKRRADVGQISRALVDYKLRNGTFPDSLDNLLTFGDLKFIPKDLSGVDYAYLVSEDRSTVAVFGNLEKDKKILCWSFSKGKDLFEVEDVGGCRP